MPPASVFRMLRLALACLVLGLIVAVPAANAASTTQILRDCADDGVLQGDYSPSELRKARQNIPTDTDEYTDCRDVLARAAAAGVAVQGRRAPAARAAPAAAAAATARPRTRTPPRAAQIVGQARRQAASRPDEHRRPRRGPRPRQPERRRRSRNDLPPGAARRADPARRRRARHPPATRPPPCPRSPRALSPRLSRPHTRTITVPWAGPGGWLTGAVALAILLATFVGRGGVRLAADDTVTEIGLMLAGAGLVAAACLRPGPRAPLHGVPLVLAFALLAVYTALSIVWSLAPADSWLEANRTLAYLAVLAGGVALVRLMPGQWAGLLYGVLAGTVLVCAWALLTKVFPGALAADETLARLRAPYEYWNSVGLTAAIGGPAAAVARRPADRATASRARWRGRCSASCSSA